MENKPPFFVCSLSGGKDSTAMLLRLLEENRPVDMILFCDTGLEFPDMYTHIDKLEKYIGRPITRIKADHSFEYYFSEAPIKRGNPEKFRALFGKDYNGYGWMGPKMRWCTNRLKDQPREQFLCSLREKYDIRQYVGIAADEKYRLERKNNQRSECIHPLVEWNMTEADCLQYCKERGFDWNGLYDRFRRVSCWLCPLQSLSELRKLWEFYPDLWEKLRQYDEMTWRKYRSDYSVKELEIRFAFENECLAKGLSVRNKAFFAALKQRLEDADDKT